MNCLPSERFSTDAKPAVSRLALAIAAILIAAVVLCTNGTASNAQSGAPAARGSQPAKPVSASSMEMIDLAGYNKILAAHRGKPLLVTFWATWCEPCRDEYPLVNQLARDYAAKGLDVVGVDMDDDSAMTVIQHFLEKNKPIFPNVRKKMGHEDAFVRGVDPQWQDQMPANFFYAADGRLLGFMIGGQPREDFEKLLRVILPPGSGAPSHP
jgi:thiol-disulfide isomerase/thioredoxin